MQALLFAALLAFARAHQDDDAFFGAVAGALFALLIFLRIDALLVLLGVVGRSGPVVARRSPAAAAGLRADAGGRWRRSAGSISPARCAPISGCRSRIFATCRSARCWPRSRRAPRWPRALVAAARAAARRVSGRCCRSAIAATLLLLAVYALFSAAAGRPARRRRTRSRSARSSTSISSGRVWSLALARPRARRAPRLLARSGVVPRLRGVLAVSLLQDQDRARNTSG